MDDTATTLNLGFGGTPCGVRRLAGGKKSLFMAVLHAEHVLGALLLETGWESARAVEAGKDTERLPDVYIRKLQKLIRDSAFRKKLAQRFSAHHTAFE
jgi:hypothetical protein